VSFILARLQLGVKSDRHLAGDGHFAGQVIASKSISLPVQNLALSLSKGQPASPYGRNIHQQPRADCSHRCYPRWFGSDLLVDRYPLILIPHLKWLISIIPHSKMTIKLFDIGSFNLYFLHRNDERSIGDYILGTLVMLGYEETVLEELKLRDYSHKRNKRNECFLACWDALSNSSYLQYLIAMNFWR